MTPLISSALIMTAVVWIACHTIVRRRLRHLDAQLPAAYQAAAQTEPDDQSLGQLTALAIDLIRKTHSTPTFDGLTPSEQRMARYAFAIETMPRWMVSYATFGVRGANRRLLKRLKHINRSRPTPPKNHLSARQRQNNRKTA